MSLDFDVRRLAGASVRLVALIMSAILASLLGVLGLLLYWSYPGRPEPSWMPMAHRCRAASPRKSLSTSRRQAGLIIESKNTANPVLLYVHGRCGSTRSS